MNIGAGFRGIIANGRPYPRGNTACVILIPAVIPRTSSPLPQSYRGYRVVSTVPITVQLSTL